MTEEYITRRSQNGLNLQVAKVGSRKYIRMTREDGVIVRAWSNLPHTKPLRETYLIFELWATPKRANLIKSLPTKFTALYPNWSKARDAIQEIQEALCS